MNSWFDFGPTWVALMVIVALCWTLFHYIKRCIELEAQLGRDRDDFVHVNHVRDPEHFDRDGRYLYWGM